jgi:hypothetical protein
MRVCLPGEVVSYSGGFADIRLTVPVSQETEDGGSTQRPLPILPKIKIFFPGGGGTRIQWTPVPGDGVIVIFCDSDPNVWIAQGGVQSTGDQRPHHLSSAIAIPVSRADDEDGGALSISCGTADIGGSSPLALASLVLTELEKITTAATGAVDGDAFLVAMKAVSFSAPDATKVRGA